MLWWEGSIPPSPNASLTVDPESNQVSHEEREWGVRRLCWSITQGSKKCTQHTAARAGFGEGAQRAEFSFCIVAGGGWVQAQTREEICAGSEHLITPFLLWYGMKHVGNARCLMNVGLQEQVTHSLICISNGTGSHPGLWGHLFWLSLCHLPPLPRPWWQQMWAGPRQSGVSGVPAPRHHRGYVPASAHCSVEELHVLVGWLDLVVKLTFYKHCA